MSYPTVVYLTRTDQALIGELIKYPTANTRRQGGINPNADPEYVEAHRRLEWLSIDPGQPYEYPNDLMHNLRVVCEHKRRYSPMAEDLHDLLRTIDSYPPRYDAHQVIKLLHSHFYEYHCLSVWAKARMQDIFNHGTVRSSRTTADDLQRHNAAVGALRDLIQPGNRRFTPYVHDFARLGLNLCLVGKAKSVRDRRAVEVARQTIMEVIAEQDGINRSNVAGLIGEMYLAVCGPFAE